MRAAGADGRHLSGAERLILADQLDITIQALLDRGLAAGAEAEFIQLTVEKVERDAIARTKALPVTTLICEGPEDRRRCARTMLMEAGVASEAFNAAWELISRPQTSTPMRGAALMECEHGSRLDDDGDRGVRATRMDYLPEDLPAIEAALTAAKLSHFRTREALLVATKVNWSGVLAEICWSDDPGYTTGYVATSLNGYVRIPEFKSPGSLGGRVFFVSVGTDITLLQHRLETQPLWVHGPLVFSGDVVS
jgi:6-carboxyhexanoate--CoA ligase